MARLVSLILTLVFMAGALQAQEAREVSNRNYKRQASYDQMVYQNSTFNSQQTLRIEKGKLWINGNLIKEENLPESLRHLDENYMLEATLFGGNEFKFSLLGRDYLLKHGKIVEIAPSYPPAQQAANDNSTMTKSDYYSNLKNDEPNQFSNLLRETELHERVMRLVLEHQIANETQRPGIRKQIRESLDELFELNIRNQQQEIKQLEQQIDAVKREIEFRKKNKSKIIDNRMVELIEE